MRGKLDVRARIAAEMKGIIKSDCENETQP